MGTRMDTAWGTPSPTLLLRRGWRDPSLFTMVLGLGWLIRTATSPARNLWLENQIGYSAVRLSILLFLAAFLYGTVQGMRGRLAVFIDDEVTPELADAWATLCIVWGIPLTLLALTILAYLVTLLAAPTGLESPKYENLAIVLLPVAWGIGLTWMYARLYAYNRGAISALIALLTKLTWSLLAVALLWQAIDQQDGQGDKGIAREILNAVSMLLLGFVLMLMIQTLTYDGPSLRD